jgi:hypothetical protein
MGTTACSFAVVCESPEAKSVTSCPRATRPLVNRSIAISVPPWDFGGTEKQTVAICAILTGKGDAPPLASTSKYAATWARGREP